VSATEPPTLRSGQSIIGARQEFFFTNVSVKTGSPKLIPAPAGLVGTAGDSRVLLLWAIRMKPPIVVFGPQTRLVHIFA
jgi:hypothetical protein